MCDHYKWCAFYWAQGKSQKNSKLFQLLINTYCKGDFHDVCRRKGYEEETGSAPIAEFGPNGYNVESLERMY